MKLINDHLAVKARIIEPNGDGYLLLAAEVGTWLGLFLPPNGARTTLLSRLKTLGEQLNARDEVREVTVLRGAIRAPGEGTEILDQRGMNHARYDVAVLIRTTSPTAALALRDGDPIYQEMLDAATGAARRIYQMTAHSAARIAEVDHGPDHAFLINYFYADDTETLLDVWEYTAGWFQAKTSLPNSTLMRPVDGEPSDYGIVNHASWPSLWTFLPSLIFRPTFRQFVPANFKANGVAAQPIIYRRV